MTDRLREARGLKPSEGGQYWEMKSGVLKNICGTRPVEKWSLCPCPLRLGLCDRPIEFSGKDINSL